MQKIKRLGNDISAAQKEAMLIVQEWVHTQKTPIPKKELFKRMINKDIAEGTIHLAIRRLLKDGYIAQAAIISNKTYYKQLRTI